MNNDLIHVNTLPPFKRMCMTIGELPTSYLETMTYYEMLVWFTEYMKNTVIPTINNNGEAIEELQNKYIELKNYVDNYFDNLDVQEEINNKLDAMAESGELTDIIAQYLGLAGILAFNTVSDMKNAENLVNGSIAKTLGFNSLNDGGESSYKIRTITNDDIVDEMSIISLYDNTLIAELITNEKVNVAQFGAKGDNSTNDYAAIQACINYAYTHNLIVEFMTKNYLITDTLKLYTNCEYNGNNCTIRQSANKPVMASAKYFDESYSGYHITINDFYLEGNELNTNNDGLILVGYYTRVNNVTVRNIGGHGIIVTSYLNNGDEFTGSTMVEGMITNCKAYSINSNKYPFYVHCNNIEITDWRIENSIFASENCSSWMYFDRISGWFLTDVQCYGKATESGIESNFGTGTQINNLTLDGIMQYGLAIRSQLGSVVANNIHINVHNSATGDIYAIRQNGGSDKLNSLIVTNINVNIPTDTIPSNLYLQRGTSFIFDCSNAVFIKNHVEQAFKIYYYKGANDIVRYNGLNITKQDLYYNNRENLANQYNLEQYSGTSTTLTLTIKPPILIRKPALLCINGEVNGASRGNSLYLIGLMRRGTTQPCTLVSEDTNYPFTNVGVTYDSTTNTYTIVATTPATSNCQYGMTVLF